MKELGTKINGKEATSENLKIDKEQQLDKYIEKRNRKKHNVMLQRDQKYFFRTLEAVEKCEGEMPKLQRFVEFWGGIWEQNEPMPNMSFMEEVKAEQESKSCE